MTDLDATIAKLKAKEAELEARLARQRTQDEQRRARLFGGGGLPPAPSSSGETDEERRARLFGPKTAPGVFGNGESASGETDDERRARLFGGGGPGLSGELVWRGDNE